MSRARGIAVNSFIVAVILLFALDAPPACCGLHRRVKQAIAPALRSVGLDQEWALYAPKPYSANTRLVVRTECADGSSTTWNSPDWTQVSQVGRFFGMRHLNLWGYVIDDECSAAWPAIADDHARNAGKAVRRVIMTRIIRQTPPPGQVPSPATEEVFFTRDYP